VILKQFPLRKIWPEKRYDWLRNEASPLFG
jgi:hypothetical protein